MATIRYATRIAITGANGQLGTSLQSILTHHQVLALTRPDFDVTNEKITALIADLEPDLVIHCAAITDVDDCERDPDYAFRVNADGTKNVASACQRSGAAMVYISTDYVFDGTKEGPYLEGDKPDPINVYGASKLAGEKYVQALLERYYIVRTAWLYGPGGKNFVENVLRLAEERPGLHYVVTEVGSPTYTSDLAEGVVRLIQYPQYGIYHLTNEGSCSRYEFAKKVLDLAGRPGFPLHPVDHYPRPAKPPPHAILANTRAASLGIRLRPWEEALAAYFSLRDPVPQGSCPTGIL